MDGSGYEASVEFNALHTQRMTMHDPMLLTDEQAAGIQSAYNNALHKLYTMLAVHIEPPQLSMSSVRDDLMSTGAYSDYRA